MMLLDQVILQDQCFYFGIRNNVLKISDLSHHLVDLRRMFRSVLKILADPVLQIFRLAYIDDLIVAVVMQVYTRFSREFF